MWHFSWKAGVWWSVLCSFVWHWCGESLRTNEYSLLNYVRCFIYSLSSCSSATAVLCCPAYPSWVVSQHMAKEKGLENDRCLLIAIDSGSQKSQHRHIITAIAQLSTKRMTCICGGSAVCFAGPVAIATVNVTARALIQQWEGLGKLRRPFYIL